MLLPLVLMSFLCGQTAFKKNWMMNKEKVKEYINNSIKILNSMNWLISTQRTEAIMYLDKAIKELRD